MAFYLRSCLQQLSKTTIQQTRTYPRWTHRTPNKVLTSEEFKQLERKFKEKDAKTTTVLQKDKDENEFMQEKEKLIKHMKSNDAKNNNVSEVFKRKWQPHNIKSELKESEDIVSKDINDEFYIKESRIVRHKAEVAKAKTTQTLKRPNSSDMLQTVVDSHGNFIFTKMKENDNRVGKLLVGIKSKKYKDKNDLILLEGKRLIKEALLNKCTLKYLLFSQKDEVQYLLPYLPKTGAEIYKMPYREMQIWSNLATCPGIMGIFKTPDTEEVDPPKNHIPLVIICDNIREPGNLGAIIRCSAGVACEKLILTNGCVNLWDPKVTRSSAGAHFKVQIHKKVNWDQINELIPSEAKVFIADNKIVSESKYTTETPSDLVEILNKLPIVPYYSVQFDETNPIVLIIGGETEGISEESYRFAKKHNGIRLNVPLTKGIDSLNTGTALGILAFEIRRQLLKKSYNILEVEASG